MSNFVNSNTQSGSYGPRWITSMEDADLQRAGLYPKIFKQFGKLYGMNDFLMGLGNEVPVSSNDQKVIEKYAPKWPVKLASAIAVGAAGGDISVVIDAASLVGGVHLAREGFAVKIPADYMPAGFKKDGVYRIKTVSGVTLTCEAFLAGTAYTKQQIATEVPAGTYIDVVSFSSFAAGSGQPVGTTDFPVTRTYTHHIIKETKGFDGGVLAKEGAVKELNGVRWLINDAMTDAEFSIKDQMDEAIIYSEPNDNTALATATTMSGQSNTVQTTRGLVSWLDDAGQSVYYTNIPELTLLDDVRDSLQTQGIYTGSVTLFLSPFVYTNLQKAAKDYIREYSGGSDFLNVAKTTLGITIQQIDWGGVTFTLIPIASLAKPASSGLTINGVIQYATGQMGFAIPDTQVNVTKWGEESNVSIPNLWLGNVEYNGEMRRNVLGRYKGMNGVFEGIDVASDLDGYKLYWLRHFMLGGAEWNKMVIIRKQKV